MAVSKAYEIETIKTWQAGQGESTCGATARIQDLTSTQPELSIRFDGFRITILLEDLQAVLEDAGVWPKQAEVNNLRGS